MGSCSKNSSRTCLIALYLGNLGVDIFFLNDCIHLRLKKNIDAEKEAVKKPSLGTMGVSWVFPLKKEGPLQHFDLSTSPLPSYIPA